MIVVDSSVWALFFNGDGGPESEHLDQLLASGTGIALMPMILTEVLQGFRTDSGFQRAKELLTRLPILAPSIQTHVDAAELYRSLRRHGVTIRSTVDCLIAQGCIENGAALFTLDRDFLRIADHSPLLLYGEWR